MTKIIEQNFFNRADFLLRPYFCFLARLIFSADDVTHIKYENSIQNQRKSYFSFIVEMSLTKICTPSEIALRQFFNRQRF